MDNRWNESYARRRLRNPAKPTRPLKSKTTVIGSGAETVPVPMITTGEVEVLKNSIEKMPPVQLGLSSQSLSSSPEVFGVQEAASRPVKAPPTPEKVTIVEPTGPDEVLHDEKISALRKVGSQL